MTGVDPPLLFVFCHLFSVFTFIFNQHIVPTPHKHIMSSEIMQQVVFLEGKSMSYFQLTYYLTLLKDTYFFLLHCDSCLLYFSLRNNVDILNFLWVLSFTNFSDCWGISLW